MAAEQNSPERCTRCDGPRDTKGTPHWCRACRAKYKRDYDELIAERSESRGYCAGISAMQDYLARKFHAIGSGSLSGYEVAALIRQSQGPSAVQPA